MKGLILVLCLALVAVGPQALAEEDALAVQAGNQQHGDDVNFVAHFGASFAINTFLYGFGHKVFRLEKGESLVFAAVLTMAGGFVYKYLEVMNGGDTKSLGRAMWQNAAGVAASAGSVLVFDF